MIIGPMPVHLISLSDDIDDNSTLRSDLRYASANNVLGRPFSYVSEVLLRPEAANCLKKAALKAGEFGCRLVVFDAWRPPEAQEALWAACPNPDYVCPPEIGSHHTRGVAVDVTLEKAADGECLNMGTGFDHFGYESGHSCLDIPSDAVENRALLSRIMTQSGWQAYEAEWWHYELPNARDYPLIRSPFGS